MAEIVHTYNYDKREQNKKGVRERKKEKTSNKLNKKEKLLKQKKRKRFENVLTFLSGTKGNIKTSKKKKD